MVSSDGLRLEWVEVELEGFPTQGTSAGKGEAHLFARFEDVPLDGTLAWLEVPEGAPSESVPQFRYTLKDVTIGGLRARRTVTGEFNKPSGVRINARFLGE